MSQDKIIERIAKLFALAGNNPSQAEADAAMAKAYAIMAEHNIDLGTIEKARKRSESPKIEQEAETNNLSERAYRWIYAAVAELHFCRYYYHRPSSKARRTTHTIYGDRTNAQAAHIMARFLCEAGTAQGRASKLNFNAFMHAYGARVHQRVKAMVAEAKQGTATSSSGTTLPALASAYDQWASWLEEYKSKALNLRETRVAKRSSFRAGDATSAVMAGDAFGRKVHIGKVIG